MVERTLSAVRLVSHHLSGDDSRGRPSSTGFCLAAGQRVSRVSQVEAPEGPYGPGLRRRSLEFAERLVSLS